MYELIRLGSNPGKSPSVSNIEHAYQVTLNSVTVLVFWKYGNMGENLPNIVKEYKKASQISRKYCTGAILKMHLIFNLSKNDSVNAKKNNLREKYHIGKGVMK